MNKESNCQFEVSDWIHFLNARALAFGEFVISKKAQCGSDKSVFIAIVAVIIAFLSGMTNILANREPIIALVVSYSFLVVFSIIILRVSNKKDKEFEKYFEQENWRLKQIEPILDSIIRGELKTSEQIRDSYLNYINEFVKRYPYHFEDL